MPGINPDRDFGKLLIHRARPQPLIEFPDSRNGFLRVGRN
jgi:hypothetical protein